MIITTHRLSCSDETLRLFSNLLVQQHVFSALDSRLHGLYGIYKFFESIMSGAIRVYGVFEDGRFLGAVWGFESDGDFEVHMSFYRGVNVLPCVLECEKVIILDHEGKVKSITGYIPDSNKAAQRLAKRYGSADMGLTWSRIFIPSAGEPEQCRIMKKIMG